MLAEFRMEKQATKKKIKTATINFILYFEIPRDILRNTHLLISYDFTYTYLLTTSRTDVEYKRKVRDG